MSSPGEERSTLEAAWYEMSQTHLSVSVIMPVYNGERFLREAIENVWAQEYTPLELIVVDDGSTDRTADIAREYDGRLCYVYQSNAGPSAARNHGIRLARGRALAFLDVDDLWGPHQLGRQAAYLAAHPSVEIVQGLVQRFQLRSVGDAIISEPLAKPYQFVNLGSAVYLRSVFEKVGLFDETMWENEDTDWFIRAWEHNVQKAVRNEVVLFYRLHAENMSRTQQLVAGGQARLLKKHLDRQRTGRGAQTIEDASRLDIRAYLGNPPFENAPTRPDSLESAQVQVRLANIWQDRGKLQRAVAGYREAIRLQPDYAWAYVKLGDLLLEQARVVEAEHTYREGLARCPQAEELHKGLVNALATQGRMEDAFAYYGLERIDAWSLEIAPNAVLCCAVVRNEAERLPFWLDYYRRLGVTRFLIVDNDSTDETAKFLLEQADVHLWHSGLPFRRANFGSAWFEPLLRSYGVRHWVVMVDADELLIYPGCESISLPELTQALDRKQKRALTAILLDMYSDRPIRETEYKRGTSFLEVCPFFDAKFFHAKYDRAGPYRNYTAFSGGARQRVFGSAGNYYLSKVPLLQYDADVVLAGGQHWTNLPVSQIAEESGCLLHFKYFANFQTYVPSEVQRREHYANAFQYREYARVLSANPDLTFYDPRQSVRFENSEQLVRLGVMRPDGDARREISFPRVESLPRETARPFWSVMITAYDRLEYLEQALKSVLDQATEEMQIEVINDGAEPRRADEIEQIVDRVGRGRACFYRHPSHLGHPDIFNLCLARARGEWVHLLHDDDWVEPGFYEALRQGIASAPNVGSAFCRQIYNDQTGDAVRLSLLERETPGVIGDWLERIAVLCRVQPPAMVVRRSVYEEVGGFCAQAGSAFDWEMWQRIAARFATWYEPRPLVHYRLHDERASTNLMRSGQQVADSRRAIEISAAYLPATLTNRARENYARYALQIARSQLRCGDPDAALRNMREALRTSASEPVVQALVALVLQMETAENDGRQDVGK